MSRRWLTTLQSLVAKRISRREDGMQVRIFSPFSFRDELRPKDEFERQGRNDVNAVQALLLFNIGNSELTAGELRSRGYYLGSNVSYNVKKLVDLGFINHQRSRIDRRSVRISLTEQGQEIAEIVAKLYERHIGSIQKVGGIGTDEFTQMNKLLQRLDRFWNDQILYRL